MQESNITKGYFWKLIWLLIWRRLAGAKGWQQVDRVGGSVTH